jgi:hypothetical protein
MMGLVVFLLFVCIVPVSIYLVNGGGHGRAWGVVPAGRELRGNGVYRGTHATLWKRGSAPFSVRAAALSSFFLGQMIVPGALAALVGVVMVLAELSRGKADPVLIILQLSAPTGLVVATYLLAAGAAMLNRHADAVVKARRAWRWAVGHNLVLLAALSAAALRGEWEAAALPAIYACISIAQALLVRRASTVLAAYAARQDEEPAPVRVENEMLGAAR